MEKNQVIYYHSASHQNNAEERMEKMEKLYEKKEGQLSWKSLLPIGLATIFVFAFAQIYGLFSHGVYSVFMSYAFLLPLSLIFLPKLLNLCTGNRLWNGSLDIEEEEGKKLFFTSLAFFLWKSGVAVLTVGSIYKGVLEIYGTSGTFEWIYLVVGILALVSGGIGVLLAKKE